MKAVTQHENSPDIALAGAVIARDRKATARFVQMHTDAVYGFVWRRLAPRVEHVDDLVQDVFVSAWTALPTYTGEASLRVWLLGIARHKVEDHYRRVLRSSLAEEELREDSPALAQDQSLDAALDRKRQSEKASAILASMPVQYSTILKWRYWESRTTREMASTTGRTEKAVERLLARARAHFAERWNSRDGAAGNG